jgi:Spy/CpxP family protein refolding chaperone
MSLRITLLTAGLAALLPLVTTSPVQALEMGHHRHGGSQSQLGFLAGVTLTDEQQAQLHQLLQASHAQIKPLEQQIHALRKQIFDQLASAAAVDGTQITALQQQAAQLREQVDEQRLATALQIRALLTPAQLAQAAQIHQQLASLHAQMKNLVGRPADNGSPSAQ